MIGIEFGYGFAGTPKEPNLFVLALKYVNQNPSLF